MGPHQDQQLNNPWQPIGILSKDTNCFFLKVSGLSLRHCGQHFLITHLVLWTLHKLSYLIPFGREGKWMSGRFSNLPGVTWWANRRVHLWTLLFLIPELKIWVASLHLFFEKHTSMMQDNSCARAKDLQIPKRAKSPAHAELMLCHP